MNAFNAWRGALATVVAGVSMWIVAGFWHNLVLPLVRPNAAAHHEGLLIGLLAYVILAAIMTYLFVTSRWPQRTVVRGLVLGAVVGVLWVFPHGLAMAGVHGTSIGYEVRNALYHVFEQGIGGVVVARVVTTPKP